MYGEGPADLHQRCLTSTLGPRPDKHTLAQHAQRAQGVAQEAGFRHGGPVSSCRPTRLVAAL